jgi:predicted RNA binding protein YcfA (HicA-like mRNA interferase family)
MARFPSLKAQQLLRVLTREPLSYRVVRRVGSHRRLVAAGRPSLTFSFHDRQTIRPATVRRILCDQVGLDEDEALRLL